MPTAWIQQARYRRGEGRSLRVAFDPASHPPGAIGLEVPPLRADQGVELWAHAEGRGPRPPLGEADGDRWAHPLLGGLEVVGAGRGAAREGRP